MMLVRSGQRKGCSSLRYVEDLMSTFFLIVTGFGISAIVLTFEVLFPRCSNKVRGVP